MGSWFYKRCNRLHNCMCPSSQTLILSHRRSFTPACNGRKETAGKRLVSPTVWQSVVKLLTSFTTLPFLCCSLYIKGHFYLEFLCQNWLRLLDHFILFFYIRFLKNSVIHETVFIYLFLAEPCSTRDLSSPTRDRTRAFCSVSAES